MDFQCTKILSIKCLAQYLIKSSKCLQIYDLCPVVTILPLIFYSFHLFCTMLGARRIKENGDTSLFSWSQPERER